MTLIDILQLASVFGLIIALMVIIILGGAYTILCLIRASMP